MSASVDLTWGLLTDVDLLAARHRIAHAEAADIARSDLVTVEAGEPLERAATLMVEHGLSHVLVLGSPAGVPVGVLSTLDVAGILAWGEL